MKQLTVKDMILTGALSALYCIGVGLGTLLAVLIFRSANMVEAPAVAALICGVVYMLLIAKVQKFGAVLLMGAIMAVFFFLSGHFILSFFPSLICGFLADLLARSGNYKSQWRNLWSYVIFSFGNLGPIFLMWFMRDAYIQKLLERGKDMAYVKEVMVDFTLGNVLYLAGFIVICALIGGWLGQRLTKKHFTEKVANGA